MIDESLALRTETVGMDSMSVDFTDDAEEYSPKSTVSGFSCEYCGKRVKTRNGLHKHKKRYHDNERRLLMKFLCSEGCSTGFPHLNLLRSHYNAKHNLPPNQISAQFPTVDAFESWKESVEQTTCSKFVVKDRRSAGQKGRTRIMYWCHRSGEASEAKGASRPKTPRTAAKTGIICTAAINAFINVDGTVDMNYFPEHWGHELDAQYLFLTREQRQDIAQRLTEGVTLEAIVESCQNSDNIRLKKVTRATVYRICRDFNVPWDWGGQEGRATARTSRGAKEPAESDDELSKSEADSNDGSTGVAESLTLRQKEALECLNQISTMVMNGAVLTRSDLDSLEAMEKRLNGQLACVEEPAECVMIVDTAEPTQSSKSSAVTTAKLPRRPPRDLNVSIINYDG